MRVCLDLSILSSRPTGIGYYGYFLGKALLEQFAEAEHYLAFDGLRFSGLNHLLDDFTRRSTIKTGVNQRLWQTTAANPTLRSAWRRVKGIAFSRGLPPCELVHAISYAPPARTAAPWVPLLTDLSHLRVPQFHPGERIRWLEAQDARIGEAVLVNTISDFTKNEIVALLGVDAARVRVTYPGVNPVFGEAQREDDITLSQFGLTPGRFLLSVGAIDPRKNLGTIATAFAQLPQSVRRDAVLVFVGQQGWSRVGFPPIAAPLRERGEIRFVGYASTDQLRALYQHTALFLYPSYYEGFGIPVAEAHLAGAPVAIAKGAGAQEAGCGLAFEAAADDVDGWSQLMRQALDDEGWRTSEARLARTAAARAFTWERNAKLTQEIYDEVSRRVH
jgi:glycosyltransferase involved in cell wall biosynthesis